MCGICGVVLPAGDGRDISVIIDRMMPALRYRGPDAEGRYVAPGIGFGHRRLKVIDLEGGSQPMTDPGGLVTLCFNGEIYNFRELRQELLAAGRRFRTASDTEVLLEGYLHWGMAVLERLAGMFAFALWDAREQTLFLVRDRLGVKPLYWGQLAGGGLVFASELSAIVASRLIEPRLRLEAASRYLAHGYVIGNESILEGVERLAPATILQWRPGSGHTVRSYWDLASIWRQNSLQRCPDEEVLARFEEHLDTAVRQRLVSDVPLGAFLSGGLDSSTVTGLMLRHLPSVRTFSVGFEWESFNELPWARRVSRELGTEHYEEVLGAVSADLLVEISGRQDEPFADTSIVPTFALCRMARQHVTVALSGDGADELLAGYVTHLADRYHSRLRHLPAPAVAAARYCLGMIPDNRRKVNALFKARQFFAGLPLAACDAHASWRMLIPPERLVQLYGAASRGLQPAEPFAPFRTAYAEAEGLDDLDRLLYVDFKTWLVDDILVKVDRASMNHGLEVRSPFLDHRLVEFCTAVSAGYKLRGTTGKYLLRRLAEKAAPTSALRRKKAGFNAPVSDWLQGPWRELAAEFLGSSKIEAIGFLDPRPIQTMLSEHFSRRRDHGHFLFSLLMLSMWVGRVQPTPP